MLKLKEICNVENVKNESDFYVRVKILFSNYYVQNKPIHYWSTMGPQQTLLEIGLGQLSGDVYEITIVSMPKDYIHRCLNISRNSIEKIGLPSLSIDIESSNDKNLPSYSDEYATRETNDFEIYVDKISVSVVLLQSEVILKVINGPIVFGFDKNNFLCFIKMNEMRLNEEGFLEAVK